MHQEMKQNIIFIGFTPPLHQPPVGTSLKIVETDDVHEDFVSV